MLSSQTALEGVRATLRIRGYARRPYWAVFRSAASIRTPPSSPPIRGARSCSASRPPASSELGASAPVFVIRRPLPLHGLAHGLRPLDDASRSAVGQEISFTCWRCRPDAEAHIDYFARRAIDPRRAGSCGSRHHLTTRTSAQAECSPNVTLYSPGDHPALSFRSRP